MSPESILQRLKTSTPSATAPARPGARVARRSAVVPAGNLLEARAFFEKGKNRDAFEVLKPFGEFKDFAGTEARLLGGDIARNLGAPRLGRYLHFRAWRSARNSLEAQAAGLNALLDVGGIYAVWRRLRQLELSAETSRGTGAQPLWLTRAWIAACFKDFESADHWWQKAEQVDAKNPILYVTLASMLEREYRYEEALLAARKATEVRPGHASGHRVAAHLLQLLNRDAESLTTLEEASRRIQNVPVLLDLARLQIAMAKHVEADATLETVISLSPILETEVRDTVLSMRAHAAWQAGNIAAAISQAREHGTKDALRFAERLEKSEPKPRRVQLTVPFVRQEQDTCAPATLVALSRFWNREAEQVAVAEEICYTGTPLHASRTWAEQHGWSTREFTVTWEAAKSLLDRGVPFAMFTQAAASGHAQAVVGYDEAEGTLIVRDSNFHQLIEYSAESLLEEQKLNGPAALVFVPAERASQLEGLELPDGGLRDQMHRFDQARDAHRREEAARILAELQAAAPSHPLTLSAQLAMALYDGNTPAAIGCLDKLLELHPDNERLQLQKLACLTEQDHRDERLALLAQACARPKCAAAFMVQYADELRRDARNVGLAGSWARRALRNRFDDRSLTCLASVRWAERVFAEAFELYKFAACLDDKSEAAAKDYYIVARHLNRCDEALNFHRARFKRYGHRSPFPAISLCQTLNHIGHYQEADKILAAALKLRPDDGEIRLFGAQMEAANGKYAEAEAHLKAAEGRVAESKLRRLRARLAARQKDLKLAIALWREILEREPLALDAHYALTQLLDESEGHLVATKYLEQVCAANPKHFGLHYQLLWRLNSDGPLAAEPVLERLIEQNPASASLRSERARWHGMLGRWAEAMKEAELAIELDPSLPAGHAMRGWILKSQGQLAEAAEAYRRALTVSVDFEPDTMQGLLSCTNTVLERRMAVNFLQTELSRHLIYGSGLLAFRDLAARHLHPDDVLKILRNILAERPDLWHAWAAVIRELTAQRLFDEAIEVAERSLARLPLCADLWNETAVLHHARKDSKKELAAREKVFELCPGNVSVMRQLASTLQRADERERAKTLLEEALRIQPRDAATLYMLGLSHWKSEEKEKAIACVKGAVCFNPDFGPAWESLQSWGHATNQPRIALEMAQTLTEQRKEDPAAWLRLARFHWGEENVTEALRVVEQAIALRATSLDAQVLKVQMLAVEDRFAEAYEVCNLPIWGVVAPAELRATEACVLEAEGRHEEAIAKMETTLADAPHLAWAWQRLADWHLAGKQQDEAKEIIERLSKALPNNPAPLLRAAAARHQAGDYPEASDLLEQALLMSPGSLEARTRLMVIQVQTNQFNALRETITILRQQGVEDWALSAEGCVALKQRDGGFACARLAELCSMPGVDYGAVEMLSGAFFNFGLGPLMRKPLRKALEAPEPFAGTGALLVAAHRAKGRLISLRKLFKLQKHRRVGQRAAIEYLHSLGYFAANAKSWKRLVTNLASRWKLLRLNSRLGTWIKSDAGAWIAFGAALAANGQNGAARRWLKDWRNRKKLRSRYYSLFELLSDLGLDADALTIGHEALRQTGGRDLLRIQLRVAWLEANLGDTKAAKKLVEELERESSLAPLCVVIRWVIRMREAKDDARTREAKEGFDSVRLSLTGEYLKKSPEYVRHYTRQSLGLLAKNGAGAKARLWARRMC